MTRCGVCGRLVGGWNGMWRISLSRLISPLLISSWEPPHTAPTARTACPTPKPPWFSGAPPASSAPCRRLRRGGASDSRGNPGRRSRPTQASHHSRPTQSTSQPPFAAYASLPAPAPELLDTAPPPEFSAPLLTPERTPEHAPRQRTPEHAPRQYPQVSAPAERPQVSALPERPQESAPPERPQEPDRAPTFPKEILGGVVGLQPERSGRGLRPRPWPWPPESPDPPWPLESPDPPWPPELPASPCRSPVSPAWSSLQGAHPPSPVDMLRCGTHLLGGRDNVRILDSLFVVFPLSFLSFLIWLFSCSCLVNLIIACTCFSFPWLHLHVFISPEFSLSLCPSTRLICCVSWVSVWFIKKKKFIIYLLAPVSFPHHNPWQIMCMKLEQKIYVQMCA